MTKTEQSFHFETFLSRLEAIVTELEGESQSLEKSLELFEEGVQLTEALKSHLEEAEQKVKLLLTETGGTIKTEEFSG